jgi:hypothetical protein
MDKPRSDSVASGPDGQLPVILLVDDDDATRAELLLIVSLRSVPPRQ